DLTGATSAVMVTLADDSLPPSNTTVMGYGGLVTLIGVEGANPGANSPAPTIFGPTQPDNNTYTPTGVHAGPAVKTGPHTPSTFTAVTGTFTIDPLGGSDTLRVNAPNSSDTIAADVSGATGTVTVSTPGPVTLKVLNFPTADTERLELFGNDGSDVFTVTPGGVPVFVDGGDPIGVLPGDKLIV